MILLFYYFLKNKGNNFKYLFPFLLNEQLVDGDFQDGRHTISLLDWINIIAKYYNVITGLCHFMP